VGPTVAHAAARAQTPMRRRRCIEFTRKLREGAMRGATPAGGSAHAGTAAAIGVASIAAARALPIVYTSVMPRFFSGTVRRRLPVAAKNAFSTAGAATQIVGSPTPPQNPPDGMMMDSTFGIWATRIES